MCGRSKWGNSCFVIEESSSVSWNGQSRPLEKKEGLYLYRQALEGSKSKKKKQKLALHWFFVRLQYHSSGAFGHSHLSIWHPSWATEDGVFETVFFWGGDHVMQYFKGRIQALHNERSFSGHGSSQKVHDSQGSTPSSNWRSPKNSKLEWGGWIIRMGLVWDWAH